MYIQLALIGDYDTLAEIGTEYIRQSMGPNWVERPGNPESILIQGSGQIAAEVIDQASLVPPEALVAIGTSIYNIPQGVGTKSTSAATATFAVDSPAVMIPIDAEIAVPHPSGSQLVFLADRDIVAPVGGGTVNFIAIALEASSEYNGCYGNSELIEITEGVTSIYVEPATTGGSDPETPEEYLDRLTDYLTIPRRPVLPGDHSALALQDPGVGRAAAYNLYYPGKDALTAGKAVGDYDLYTPQPPPATPQSPVARCTTVAIMSADGSPPSPDLMQRVYENLDANREVNFLNFVVSPTFTGVDVKCSVKPYTGTDPDDVKESVKDSVSAWLSPEEWSQQPGANEGTWETDSKVRLYEAVDYINRAPGVWYCEAVQLKLHSSSTWLTADVDLPGIAPIPTINRDTDIYITII